MIYWDDAQSIKKLEDVIRRNEIILASGDTVLGLWGNLTHAAFEKINQIKQRHDKPYLITIGSADKLSKFIDQDIDDTLQTLIQTCWPGPVTLVFKAREDVPVWMKSSDNTIALRVPDHDGLLQLLQSFDGLFSTSANRHGQPVANCVDQVDPIIMQAVSQVCIESEQQCYSQSPSTILDCSSGKIKVLRSGAMKVEELKDLLT